MHNNILRKDGREEGRENGRNALQVFPQTSLDSKHDTFQLSVIKRQLLRLGQGCATNNKALLPLCARRVEE